MGKRVMKMCVEQRRLSSYERIMAALTRMPIPVVLETLVGPTRDFVAHV